MVQRVVACTSATWETGSPARISPARTRPTSCSSTFEATSTSLRSSLMPSFPLADQADQHSRRFAALVIGTNAIVSGTPILGCSTCDRPHATSRKSSNFLKGPLFWRDPPLWPPESTRFRLCRMDELRKSSRIARQLIAVTPLPVSGERKFGAKPCKSRLSHQAF
jgi:hypothetical protein